MKTLDEVKELKWKYLESLYTLPGVKTCGIGKKNGKFCISLGISSEETLERLRKICMSVEGVAIRFYLCDGKIVAQKRDIKAH